MKPYKIVVLVLLGIVTGMTTGFAIAEHSMKPIVGEVTVTKTETISLLTEQARCKKAGGSFRIAVISSNGGYGYYNTGMYETSYSGRNEKLVMNCESPTPPDIFYYEI